MMQGAARPIDTNQMRRRHRSNALRDLTEVKDNERVIAKFRRKKRVFGVKRAEALM
jgi:hypothetical protein